MNTICKKAFQNLEILKSLSEKDNVIIQDGNIVINNDYDQINNMLETEYCIYRSFHDILTITDQKLYYQYNLIKLMDDALEGVFLNDGLQNYLSSNDQFEETIQDIDEKVVNMKDSYYYQSPFYKCYFGYVYFIDYLKDTMYENNKYVEKMFRNTYIDNDDNDDNDDLSSSESERVTLDEEDIKKMSQYVDNKELINENTGESNPNLIYDDDKLKKVE